MTDQNRLRSAFLLLFLTCNDLDHETFSFGRIGVFLTTLNNCIDIQKFTEEQDSILKFIRSSKENQNLNDITDVNQLIRPLILRFARKNTVKTFRLINHYCQHISKLTLETPELVERIEREFFEKNEDRSHYVYNSPIQYDLLGRLTSYFQKIQDHFDITKIKPKVSGGATAEVARKFGLGPKVNYLRDEFTGRYKNVFPYNLIEFISDQTWSRKHQRPNTWVAQLCLVPKGIYKKRPISEEQTVLAYVQQGVRSCLIDACSKVFQNFVLDEYPDGQPSQIKSQLMALEGSREWNLIHTFVTTDLSSASDDVTLNLIKKICPECLFDTLDAVRSQYLLDSHNGLHEQFSWAGMGNAVTFPLEMAVFCAIIEVAYDIYEETYGYKLVREYKVYGDDMIYPAIIHDIVIQILYQLNFHVNFEKSYATESPFREACGIEAFHGANVTPFRLSRKIKPELFLGGRIRPEDLSSLLAYINFCYAHSMHNTRRFLIESLLGKRRIRESKFLARVSRTINYGPLVNDSLDITTSYSIAVDNPDTSTETTVEYFNRRNSSFYCFDSEDITVIDVTYCKNVKPYVWNLTEEKFDLSDDEAYWLTQEQMMMTRRCGLIDPVDRIDRYPGPTKRMRVSRTSCLGCITLPVGSKTRVV